MLEAKRSAALFFRKCGYNLSEGNFRSPMMIIMYRILWEVFIFICEWKFQLELSEKPMSPYELKSAAVTADHSYMDRCVVSQQDLATAGWENRTIFCPCKYVLIVRNIDQFNWLSWWITTTQKDTNAVDRKHNKEKWPLHFLSFHSHDCCMGCIRFSLSHRRIRNWTNAPMHVHEENEKTHIYMTMWHTQTNWIEPKISHLLVRECDKLCTAISKNIILNTFVRDQSCK